MINFTRNAAAFPPVLCRLLARHRYGRPLTNQEISERSGLSPVVVVAISECVAWKSIPFGDMLLFLKGCGIDFTDRAKMKSIRAYMRIRRSADGARIVRRPTFSYLKKDDQWESYYLPLMHRYFYSVNS